MTVKINFIYKLYLILECRSLDKMMTSTHHFCHYSFMLSQKNITAGINKFSLKHLALLLIVAHLPQVFSDVIYGHTNTSSGDCQFKKKKKKISGILSKNLQIR